MLLGSTRHPHRLIRLLITALAGLWLLAGFIPCTFAADTCCDSHPAGAGTLHEQDAAKAGPGKCDPSATLDCALPDPQPPPAADQLAKLAAAVVGVRAPLALVPSGTAAERRYARHQTQLLPPPPRLLRNAVLLI